MKCLRFLVGILGIVLMGAIPLARPASSLADTPYTLDTTRGRLFFRKIDNQLSCSVYFGRVADDPRYPFPIYHDLSEIKAQQCWRPEPEIRKARNK